MYPLFGITFSPLPSQKEKEITLNSEKDDSSVASLYPSNLIPIVVVNRVKVDIRILVGGKNIREEWIAANWRGLKSLSPD